MIKVHVCVCYIQIQNAISLYAIGINLNIVQPFSSGSVYSVYICHMYADHVYLSKPYVNNFESDIDIS